MNISIAAVITVVVRINDYSFPLGITAYEFS